MARLWPGVLLCVFCGVLGCAGTYRAEPSAVGLNAPAYDVVALRWQHRLAHRDVFDYRPQEWASAAIAADGSVYVGSSAQRLLAFQRNGRMRWSFKTQGAVSSKPLIDGDKIYFGADDGVLYALDRHSGRKLFAYPTRAPIINQPRTIGGLVLFTNGENRVYAIDGQTGKWRWQYDREAPEGFTIQGHAGILLHGDLAYTGFSDGVTVALNARTGAVEWAQRLCSDKKQFVDVDSTPVLIKGLLVSACYAGGVYALDPQTGAVRWHVQAESVAHIAADDQQIFYAAPRAGLVALTTHGSESWRQALPNGTPTAPVSVGRYVAVSSTRSGLFIARKDNGALVQYFDPGHGISAPAAVHDETMVLLSNHGRLFAFDIRGN